MNDLDLEKLGKVIDLHLEPLHVEMRAVKNTLEEHYVELLREKFARVHDRITHVEGEIQTRADLQRVKTTTYVSVIAIAISIFTLIILAVGIWTR